MDQTPVCVVAGVGPDIGLAVAKGFAREGFDIALLARRGAALRGFAAEMAADGNAAHAFEVDLSQPAMIRHAFQTIEDTLGSPSVLIYNAAAWHEGRALNPEYGAHLVSLTAGKAAMRGVALALAAHLEPMGIHIATVTVTGRVGPQTAFDPYRIADEYWYLHTQTRGNWTREIIFKGR